MAAFREAAEIYKVAGGPDLNSALRIPGMLTTGDEEELGEDVAKALLAAAADAVAALNKVREREGAATAEEMRQRCRSICSLVVRMEEIRAGAVGVFQKRLREKLADLLHGAGIEPQRLVQEAAILADRSDISEELMRLRTHAGQLEQLLNGAGEVGKRLDFLLQEMNRESNTVLSKTGGLGDLGLTITDLSGSRASTSSSDSHGSDHRLHHFRPLWLRQIDAGRTPSRVRSEPDVLRFLYYPPAPRRRGRGSGISLRDPRPV
jgi:uncharacterized protein (TIGR00255 family)